MSFITVREAAEKWQVTPRLVQRYCAQGRIPGARKMGAFWGIPTEASKPTDPRTKRGKGRKAAKEPPACPAEDFLPLMQAAFPPGKCLEYLHTIGERPRRKIALAEYYYYTGQCEKALVEAKPFLTADSLPLRLSALLISIFSNISARHIRESQTGIQTVRALLDENRNASPELRALLDFSGVLSHVLSYQPLPAGVPYNQEYVHQLPMALRPMALYVHAHYFYSQENHTLSIGVAETALVLGSSVSTLGEIYLHLGCVMAYGSLKRMDRAREHMVQAWAIARPDGFFQGFGERHGGLCGMLEAVVKPEYPENFRKVVRLSRNFLSGWRKLHRIDTGDIIKEQLTPTEFSVASLMANGWKNREIAAYMGVSIHTVKSHVSDILQKLNIQKRSQIQLFNLN